MENNALFVSLDIATGGTHCGIIQLSGIKVFAFCCSVAMVLLGFEIYTGKENGASAAAIAIIERLIHKSGLAKACSHILYNDNWYTSVNLAMLIFEKYGWQFCGTIVPTKKYAPKDDDIPFHKLSTGALGSFPCGWYHEAALMKKFRRK